MGCAKSRFQRMPEEKKVIVDIKEIDMQGSRTDKFEARIPIRRTDVKQYCAAIKELGTQGDNGISIETLMDHMSAKFAPWKEANQPDSLFMQILNEYEPLRDPDNKSLLSKKALQLWGIILCSGDNKTKVSTFYSVLQDIDQPSIAAIDKDFPYNFYLMVLFATTLVNTYEPRLSKQLPEHPDSQMKKIEQH